MFLVGGLFLGGMLTSVFFSPLSQGEPPTMTYRTMDLPGF